jgi:hypothetical protein
MVVLGNASLRISLSCMMFIMQIYIAYLPEFWFVDYLTQVFDLVLCIFDGGLYLFEGLLQSIRG